MITTSHKTEFWFHVSDQEDIPIFGTVDKSFDIPFLIQIIQNLPADTSRHEDYIKELIKSNPKSVDILRTFVGVSDKRMYLELSYIFAKTKLNSSDTKNVLGYSIYELEKHNVSFFKSLTQYRRTDEISAPKKAKRKIIVDKSIKILTDYLISKGILSILIALKKLDQKEITTLIDCLIMPSEIQQAETKRRGHGAEWQLAILLHKLGVNFIPSDKHTNPMSSDDPNVDKITFLPAPRNEEAAWSFDIIIKQDAVTFKIFVQGLIHTSDPGQYGVNKSGETVLIKQGITNHNRINNTSKELWGLVDGVGFIENPDNTVFKMLNAFDTFIQLKTLYKAGLRLHQLRIVTIRAIKFDMTFYTVAEADAMFAKYGSANIQKVTDDTTPAGTQIPAGKAWLYI